MNDQSHQFDPARPDPTDARALMGAVVDNARELIGAEVELAKREMKRKATRIATGIALIAAGLVLAFAAIDVLTAAAVAAIAEAGLPVSIASLIVGGGAIALAVVLFLVGRSRMKIDSLMPDRAIRNVQRDFETIKETTGV